MARYATDAQMLAARFGRSPAGSPEALTVRREAARAKADAAMIPGESRQLHSTARLTVSINGIPYVARIKAHHIDLKNDRGFTYTVRLGKDMADDRCNCPSGPDCQHIGALRALRLIPATRPKIVLS